MASHRESVIMAVIAVILVSIPAASQTVEISGGENKIGVIDSKFSDRFEVNFKPGRVVKEIKDSRSRLYINNSFDRKVEKLETSGGSVKIVSTNNSIEKTVQTPYGRFNFGVRKGESYSSFEGSDKDEAEKIKSELLNRVEERSSEVSDKHELVVEKMLPEIVVSVNDDPSVEHFNLTNKGEDDVDLTGWTVLAEGSGKDHLDLKRTIESGETVTYYSGDDEVPDFDSRVVEDDITVYSDGEVKLYNSADMIVDRLDY